MRTEPSAVPGAGLAVCRKHMMRLRSLRRLLTKTVLSDLDVSAMSDKTTAPSSAQRRPDAIMDGSLYPRHYTSDLEQRNGAFFLEPRMRSHFASQLLLYEHVIIPTNDFAIVPALLQWMGRDAFEEALDSGTVTFLRRKGSLMYAGSGVGLNEYTLSDATGKPFDWAGRAFWGDLGEAIELQLLHGQPDLAVAERQRLVQKAAGQSQTVEYASNDYFIKNVTTESYTDIRDTPELRSVLMQLAAAAGSKPGEALDMARLPGVEANSFQIAGPGPVSSLPELVVRVAEANMDIVLAEFAGGTDLYASRGMDALLKSKLLRAGCPSSRLQGFIQLLKINSIPDIRPAVESGALALPNLWKIRQSRRAKHFREWLAKADVDSADDFVRLYRESLEQTSLMESLPARIIRYGIITAVGFWNPLVAAGAGLVDTLFTEKFIKGYRPKLMVNELAKLFPSA